MNDSITFENALLQLEKIVRELESSDTPLDESVKLFEEGIKLSGICSKHLKEAQQKVELLTESIDGEPVAREFEKDE